MTVLGRRTDTAERQAVAAVSLDQLAAWLLLPAGVRLVGVVADYVGGGVRFHLEGPGLPPGADAVALRPRKGGATLRRA